MHPDATTPAPDRLRPAPAACRGACAGAPFGANPAEAGTRRLSSTELLGGARELEISHGDALYHLRLTSLGKLILTK